LSALARIRKDPEHLIRAMDDNQSNAALSFLSSTLTSLESLYASGLSTYLYLEKLGLRKRMRVPVPVISIGNLSVGGTGKTPATIAIAKHLLTAGLKIAVLSRGHGGSVSRRGGIVSDDLGNILLTTEEAGDEPMVLALALPNVPVLVGKDRRQSAALAISRFKPDLLLLDDGFQYWQLARDVDVVLLDANRPFDNEHCLPRGLLREPKNNLRRSQIVLATRSSGLSQSDRLYLCESITKLAPDARVFYANHTVEPVMAANEPAVKLGNVERVLALCAIARPDSFLETLATVSISPVETVVLPDHFHYQVRDAKKIVGKMKECRADSIVTTQKDFVKINRLLPNVPLFVLPIKFTIDCQASFLSDLFNLLKLPASLLEPESLPC